MQEFVTQLGIDGKLLLSQVVNFVLLIFILRYFLYKPVLKMLHDRRNKIKEGIDKAEEADARLHTANKSAKETIKGAEIKSLDLIGEAEVRAKNRETELLEETHKKEGVILQNAERLIESKTQQSRKELEKETEMLVKNALSRITEIAPEQIDDVLIEKAVRSSKKK